MDDWVEKKERPKNRVIFQRMNSFIKQSSSYITIVVKEKKKWRKIFGIETKKNSFILSSSSTGENSSHNCCQNLYKVKERKDSFSVIY